MAEILHHFFGVEQLPGIAALVGEGGELVAGNLAFRKLPLDPKKNSGSSPEKALCQRSLLDAGIRCLRKGAGEIFEIGECAEGSPVLWFRGTAVLISGLEAIPRVLVHCTDTSAEKIELESRRRMERLLTEAQGIAHLGTWEWSPSVDRVIWSEELYRIYAVSPETHKPTFKSYLEQVHPDDRDRVRSTMEKALAARTDFSHDERVLRPDGSIRHLHTWGHPVFDDAGKILRLVGVCQDITERVEAAEQLRQSEARYRQIVETAEEGVWVIDENAQTTFANQKMAETLGYQAREMCGWDFFHFVDKDHQAFARANLQRRREGVREHHDLLLRRKDGRRLTVEMASCPIHDARGAYAGALAMVRDVTEQRQHEVLLSTQRSIFELLVKGEGVKTALEPLVRVIETFGEGVLASILLLSEDGRRLHTGAAPSLPQEFNLALNGVEVGPNVGSCGTAAVRKEIVIVDDIETDPLWESYRSLALKFDLRACWSSPILAGDTVLGTFALYFREKRSPTEYDLKLVRDFSAAAALVIRHGRMRESLAESEARFRLLSDAASEGVAIHENGRLLVANESMAAMLGYEGDELVGMNILGLAAPGYRGLLEEKMRPGNSVHYEAKALRKDGSSIWAEIKGRDAFFQGKPVRLAAIRDISEEKQFEEDREALLVQERVAREQAERAIKVRDEFLAIASHELKTPLTPLKIELQLLRRYFAEFVREPNPKSDILARAVNLGEKELTRLSKLISDLLDVTRISAGRLDLNRSQCDLSEIVRLVTERYGAQLDRERCALDLELAPSVPGLWDRERIDQVVTNLLTNAMKYGAGTPIHVKVSRAGGHARLAIADEGIGIAKDEQGKIFERFMRLAPLENYGGLGLGLFIVKQIVAAHGGTVGVESDTGKGARFVVNLPVAD